MRVLVLVIAFAMMAAAMVYVPAIATFRDNWLRNRLSAAYTAALVLDAAPQAMVPPELSRELLDSVGACIIVLSKNGTKRILAASELPRKVDEVYDFRDPPSLASPSAISTLRAPPGRFITVLGEAPRGGESIAITMKEAPLTTDMRAYSLRLLSVTLLMSASVAMLATIAIQFMVLRPLRRLTASIVHFKANPEHGLRTKIISRASHEIGHAEEELAIMQNSLARELNEKKHLAALGLAVAKINHDMRNMLTSAQLISDRLTNVNDPLVQRLGPKLVATLDRAIRFCQSILTYGRAVDEPPKLLRFELRSLVEEVIETVGLDVSSSITFLDEIPSGLDLSADREQLFRVLVNLIRNACEALQSFTGAEKTVRVKAWQHDQWLTIEVADSGPGVPEAARAHLFTPFNSERAGGSGLGLVIAADLVRGHGGTIELLSGEEEGHRGAIFHIILPQSSSEVP